MQKEIPGAEPSGMADGGKGGRDRTEAVGDFPAQLLHSSGEHKTGLQDSHTWGAQPGGAGMGLGVRGAHPELRGLGCWDLRAPLQGKREQGACGGWLCSKGETPGCPSAAGTGSAGAAALGKTGTPQALRSGQQRDLLLWGGIPRAKDNTRATPRGDFAHAARI